MARSNLKKTVSKHAVDEMFWIYFFRRNGAWLPRRGERRAQELIIYIA